MIKIILNGAGGRMGKAVKELLGNKTSALICAEADNFADEIKMKSVREYMGEADVLIDFSHHSAIKELLSYACERKIPAVIATTGHSDEEKALIYEAAKSIPVFYSANMSLGIAALNDFAKRAAALFPDADIEIIEAHHNRKLDAPSGTAIMLAEGLKEIRPEARFVYGRQGMTQREKNEIGIHALRMGNETGMHEIIISTDYQSLSLKHNAHSRSVFAEGALSAAEFITGKTAGLYSMPDIMKL